MEFNNGFFQKPFESTINHLTLRFLNKEMEKKYTSIAHNFSLLSAKSKYLFIFLGIGALVVYGLDIIAAVYTSPYYSYSSNVWVFVFMMVPTSIIEVICFKCERFSLFRGIAFTILGTPTQFIRNYGSFESQVYYPFIGAEYFLM